MTHGTPTCCQRPCYCIRCGSRFRKKLSLPEKSLVFTSSVLQLRNWLNEASSIIEMEITAKEMLKTIHGHPTYSEVMYEVSADVLGMAIHYLRKINKIFQLNFLKVVRTAATLLEFWCLKLSLLSCSRNVTITRYISFTTLEKLDCYEQNLKTKFLKY